MGLFMMEKLPHTKAKLTRLNQYLPLKCGFGIGYGIGRKYRTTWVLGLDLNQNSGFDRTLGWVRIRVRARFGQVRSDYRASASVKSKVQDVDQTSFTFDGMFFQPLVLKEIEYFEKLQFQKKQKEIKIFPLLKN